MIYIAPAVGNGSVLDPYRPQGWDSSKSGWISLYDPALEDPSQQLFLLSLESPLSDSKLEPIGADKDDPILDARLDAINAKLGGAQLSEKSTTADLIAELLFSGFRCPPLKPTLKGESEIWLDGEKIWSMKGIKGGASYQTAFPTTENPISEAGVWATGHGAQNPLEVTGGRLRTTIATAVGFASIVSPSIGGDQYSQVEFVTMPVATNLCGVAIRTQSSTTPSYYVFYNKYNVANTMQLFRMDNAVSTQLGADYSITRSIPDTHRLEGSGSTLTPVFNGASQATRTDSTYATGQPGVMLFSDSVANCEADNFDGGDLAGGPVIPVFMNQYRQRRLG